MPFTLHTDSWALQAGKLLSGAEQYWRKDPLQIRSGLVEQASFSCCHSCGVHSSEWAWLYGTFCFSSFSWWHTLEQAVTCLAGHLVVPLGTLSNDSNSFWLAGAYAYPSAPGSVETSETQRRCIQCAVLFAWESDLGRTWPLTRRVGKAKLTRNKLT